MRLVVLLLTLTVSAQRAEPMTSLEANYDAIDHLVDGIWSGLDQLIGPDIVKNLVKLKSIISAGKVLVNDHANELRTCNEERKQIKESTQATPTGLGELSMKVKMLIERLKKCEAEKTGDDQASCDGKLDEQLEQSEKKCRMSTDALEDEVKKLKEQLAQPQQSCEAVENDLDACKIAREQEGQQANEEIQKLTEQIQGCQTTCPDDLAMCKANILIFSDAKTEAESQLSQCSARLGVTDAARQKCEEERFDLQKSIDRLTEEVKIAVQTNDPARIRAVRAKLDYTLSRIQSVDSRFKSYFVPQWAALNGQVNGSKKFVIPAAATAAAALFI